MALTTELVEQYLPQILAAIPAEWRGTTYNNKNLLGREIFCERLTNLKWKKSESSDRISTEDLMEIGNAEDYLRVASNMSTLLEMILAQMQGCPVSQVFAFASDTMPVLSVVLTSKGKPVHLYTGADSAASPFSPGEHELLKLLGGKLVWHPGTPVVHAGDVVLATQAAVTPDSQAAVDGIIMENVLYINNAVTIVPSDIMVIRKRMATPPTTPMAEAQLQALAKVKVTANLDTVDSASEAAFYAHLQTLAGTPVNTAVKPYVGTAGLPSLCTLWFSLIAQGGADLLMCSTAYGGCSQLVDLLHEKAATFKKSTFDIQGGADITVQIKGALDKLASDPAALAPSTILFVEVPTNPDMKVPDMKEVTATLQKYKEATKKKVLLLVDATFAPNSKVLAQVKEMVPELPAMSFISLSKSVSRGLTTAGCMIANHTEYATELINHMQEMGKLVGTVVKPDQLHFLVNNHTGVEERCAAAYAVAKAVGDGLQQAVKQHASYDMKLAFVSPDQAALGFTTSTFSFNLPRPAGASPAVTEALAQTFVDLLCAHPPFKPCVSFGQDNGLVYCTVPATSTQGAIKAEDKAKQAVGGVQLTRLSFPPTCDVPAVIKIINDSVATIYSN